MNKDIKVTFIIPSGAQDENECSEDMQLAYVACKQYSNGGLETHWIREEDYNQFEGLTKEDVFVLSEFEGMLFMKLKATKCLLVGPRCLSCCLTEGTPIPSGPEPVFTVAMRGLVVTASGLTKQKKEEIKKKVYWMGGIYNPMLLEETTHLVSDTVLSDKYFKSVEKGIPIMSETWIEAVWETSLRLNVNGASSDFKDYKLPTFANLQVTTSGIAKKEKQTIMKLISENGGVFSGAFQSETTDVVVLTKDSIGSEKYKAAVEYGKACVVTSWVTESAARGVALPLARYRVTATAATSSPLAGHHKLPDMSLNFSRITSSKPPCNFVEESKVTDLSTISCKTKLSQDIKRANDNSTVDKEIIDAFDNFDMSLIKKAGSIFDGFCIYVCGLEGGAREVSARVVSRAGGVRYSEAHPRVTHAVAGTRAAAANAAREVPGVPVLSPLWLLHSVAAGTALPEVDYLLDSTPTTPAKSARKPRVEPESPMSKRNLQLLRRLDLPPPAPAPPDEPPDEPLDEIVNHYLSQNALAPDEPQNASAPKDDVTLAPDDRRDDVTEDLTIEQPTEEIEQIFRDIKLEVQSLEPEAALEVGAEVRAAGGTLLAAGGGGSHVLVPMDFDTDDLVNKDAEAVTVFWIRECLSQQELVPVQYYHRPVRLPAWPGGGPGPLAGVVASLSTYSGVERAFLDELAKLLGATTQLRFCRRTTATAAASTHLICPAASGDKYAGAVKWGLPAVTARWLLACADAGARVPEQPYLVGETRAPLPPVPVSPTPALGSPRKQTVTAADEQTRTDKDKENEMLPPANATVPKGATAASREHSPTGNKLVVDEGTEMSPASRYIAMARQGLLADSQQTPSRLNQLKMDDRQEGSVETPPLDEALSTPNLRGFSPITKRRLQAVKRGEMPSDPIRTPNDPFTKGPPTPDSTFGAALRPGSRLSPEARKRLWTVVNDLPDKLPNDKGRQTPLSEIRNRFLAQFTADSTTPTHDHHAAPRKLILQDQAETPPAKMPKLFQDQSASSGFNFTDNKMDITSKSKNVTSVKSPPSVTKPSISTNKVETPSIPAAVDAQLERLNAVLSGRNSAQKPKRSRDSVQMVHAAVECEPGPESQPNTVGWDDTAHPPAAVPVAPAGVPARLASPPALAAVQQPTVKRFMLSSNVDNREDLTAMIVRLGGLVCDSSELDPAATHLLCAAPGRSEKMLGCVAGGKWVLHPAYVASSAANGAFLEEELFEWGNPKATCLPALSGAEKTLARAAYRWRSARAAGAAGPFRGVAALLHVPAARRRLLARLVRAGGGLAPDHQPPYSDESITVCFADTKRYPLSAQDAAWLKSRRIPVCPPVLLSSYLTDEPAPDPMQHCLPEYRP